MLAHCSYHQKKRIHWNHISTGNSLGIYWLFDQPFSNVYDSICCVQTELQQWDREDARKKSHEQKKWAIVMKLSFSFIKCWAAKKGQQSIKYLHVILAIKLSIQCVYATVLFVVSAGLHSVLLCVCVILEYYTRHRKEEEEAHRRVHAAHSTASKWL